MNLPEELFRMGELMSLSCSTNQLASAAIPSLSEHEDHVAPLRALFLDNNTIGKMSPIVRFFSYIRVLNLDNNNLGCLPSEIYGCKNLNLLSASCNFIRWVLITFR